MDGRFVGVWYGDLPWLSMKLHSLLSGKFEEYYESVETGSFSSEIILRIQTWWQYIDRRLIVNAFIVSC
jgi:hypothetical protein